MRERSVDLPPADLADLLLDLGKEERVLVFRAIPRDPAAEAFSHLDPDQQELLLRDLSDEEARALLAYPEEIVGRLMTPDHVAVRKHWTAE